LLYGCGTALMIFVASLVGGALVIMQWLRPQPAGHSAAVPAAVPVAGSIVLVGGGQTIEYSDPNGMCHGENLAVRQTPTEVVLSLSQTGPNYCTGFRFGPSQSAPAPALDPAAAILPSHPDIPAALPYAIEYILRSPLGNRRLVDALTGKTIPCFDERTAFGLVGDQARWAPLALTNEVSTSAPYFGGHGAAVLVTNYVGFDVRPHRRNWELLAIVQVIGGGWHPPPWTVTRRVVVSGHHGLAAPGIVVWTVAGRTVAVVGQGPPQRQPGAAGGFARGPLPLAQLLAIASRVEGSGLPPWGKGCGAVSDRGGSRGSPP
jgi:hypothetical protein